MVTIWTLKRGLSGPLLPAMSVAWATSWVVPLVRLNGSWKVNEPLTVDAVAVAWGGESWPLMMAKRVTRSPGSVLPVNLGRWLAVTPSPLTPVSSAGRIDNVGTTWG